MSLIARCVFKDCSNYEVFGFLFNLYIYYISTKFYILYFNILSQSNCINNESFRRIFQITFCLCVTKALSGTPFRPCVTIEKPNGGPTARTRLRIAVPRAKNRCAGHVTGADKNIWHAPSHWVTNFAVRSAHVADGARNAGGSGSGKKFNNRCFVLDVK